VPDTAAAALDRSAGGTVYITDEHRSGTITAMGIVLGFSLSFLVAYSLDEGDWTWWGLLILGIFGAGIWFQVKALRDLLLLPESGTPHHTVRDHNAQANRFLFGTAIVFCAFVLWVALDVVL
jgi:hypothetical protein